MAETKKLTLTWHTCGNDSHWCDFYNLDLFAGLFNDLKGVYIIWSGKQVVRLGSGIIKDRIAAHRKDKKITAYSDLKVTWAKVNANQMKGVEKYLADNMNPAVGGVWITLGASIRRMAPYGRTAQVDGRKPIIIVT